MDNLLAPGARKFCGIYATDRAKLGMHCADKEAWQDNNVYEFKICTCFLDRRCGSSVNLNCCCTSLQGVICMDASVMWNQRSRSGRVRPVLTGILLCAERTPTKRVGISHRPWHGVEVRPPPLPSLLPSPLSCSLPLSFQPCCCASLPERSPEDILLALCCCCLLLCLSCPSVWQYVAAVCQ